MYSANTNMASLQLPAPRRIFQMQTSKWLFAVSFMLVQTQLMLALKLLQLTEVVVWVKCSHCDVHRGLFHCVSFSLKGESRWPEKRCHLPGSEVWAMNAVKCSEVRVSGPEDRLCPGHLQRATQGRGDAAQLTGRRNHVLKKQLPSTEGIYLFSFRFNPSIQGLVLQLWLWCSPVRISANWFFECSFRR